MLELSGGYQKDWLLVGVFFTTIDVEAGSISTAIEL